MFGQHSWHSSRAPFRRSVLERRIWSFSGAWMLVLGAFRTLGRRKLHLAASSATSADAASAGPYGGCDSLFLVNALAFDRAVLTREVNFDRQHFSTFREAPGALAFDRIDALGCLELRFFNDIHAAPVSGPARGTGALLRRAAAGKQRRG